MSEPGFNSGEPSSKPKLGHLKHIVTGTKRQGGRTLRNCAPNTRVFAIGMC